MSDDSISRQAVLDMLEDINNHIIDGYGYRHDWCVEWVKGLPSIGAVKHGRWTLEDCHSATYKYCCSICGAHHRARYDYCPSCGARMDEETCNNTEEKMR